MSKIVTVMPGTLDGDNVFSSSNELESVLSRLISNPPPGYLIQSHKNLGELREGLAPHIPELQFLEIVADGNPRSLGVIDPPHLADFVELMAGVGSSCKLYLSGCNTGTWTSNGYSLAADLANKLACEVYGTVGYVNLNTLAEGTIEACIDLWGRAPDIVYEGAHDEFDSKEVFQRAMPGASIAHTLRFPSRSPIQLMDRRLSLEQKSLLERMLGSLGVPESKRITLNPRVAPDFTVEFDGRVYDFLYDGHIVREKHTESKWKIPHDREMLRILSSLWVPE
jgi:hypothetical protein